MRHAPNHLSPIHRQVVLAALIDTCTRRNWTLMAAHIRPTHLHLVISANRKPEQIMGIIKAHATRCLDESDGTRRPRWSRHGSTRYLWNQTQISAACRYVLDGQGDRLTVYPARLSLCPQQPLTNHATR